MSLASQRLSVFCILFALGAEIGLVPSSAAATVEEIALMNRPDRQKILIEGAKKEGKISWYTTLIVDQVVRPVKDAFEKEYPFLQVEFFRGNAERLVQKMFAEYQAKRYDVDIHRRHRIAYHGAARRLSSALFLTGARGISSRSQGCPGILGHDQSLFLRDRLQHEDGQTQRGSEDLRGFAQSTLERPNDVVNEPRLGRAHLRRHDSQHDGTRSG